jgi:hypothetical protein
MLALDGCCKTLDAAADGYVRAEAAIVIRLDPMGGPGLTCGSFDDPGDDSRPAAACLMAGSFVNQDGRSSSLTAPNGPSQQQVPQRRGDNCSDRQRSTASRLQCWHTTYVSDGCLCPLMVLHDICTWCAGHPWRPGRSRCFGSRCGSA